MRPHFAMALLGSVACARDEVSFDFGWKFRLGASGPPQPPPPPSPPLGCTGEFAFQNASGLQCGGLGQDSNAQNAADCELDCCNDNACGVWQWAEGAGGGCWRGQCTAFNRDARWVGGNRTAPFRPAPTPAPPAPGATPPEALPGYDDTTQDWSTVHAPHDSLIALPVSKALCPTGCSGRSYIPRYPSWYRKHFNLPAAWEDGSSSHSSGGSGGSLVHLRFDGVFRECEVWLNGVNVTEHTSGYTSFTVPLSAAKQASLRFGAGAANENVLAVFIDPDKGKSGWWCVLQATTRACERCPPAGLPPASSHQTMPPFSLLRAPPFPPTSAAVTH